MEYQNKTKILQTSQGRTINNQYLINVDANTLNETTKFQLNSTSIIYHEQVEFISSIQA